MALSESGKAPYGPVHGVEATITAVRDKGLPTPVTVGTLERLGVEESLARRTLAGLKILDLVTEDGELTETMKKIKVAASSELDSVLADWLRSAYAPIFQFVDPTDDVTRIADQFRHYEPAGMRNRMVSLFLGLCHLAGMIDKKPVMPRGPAAKKTASAGSDGRFVKARRVIRTGSKPADQKKNEEKAADNNGGPDRKDADAHTARDQYVAMLISRADKADDLDPDLLDRIERALGISGGVSG